MTASGFTQACPCVHRDIVNADTQPSAEEEWVSERTFGVSERSNQLSSSCPPNKTKTVNFQKCSRGCQFCLHAALTSGILYVEYAVAVWEWVCVRRPSHVSLLALKFDHKLSNCSRKVSCQFLLVFQVPVGVNREDKHYWCHAGNFESKQIIARTNKNQCLCYFFFWFCEVNMVFKNEGFLIIDYVQVE